MAISSTTMALPSNFTGSHREKLSNQIAEFFELKAPTEAGLQRVVESDGEVGPFGLKIPIVTVEPGGHGGFTLASPSFNNPVPLDTEAMYATPVGYAIAMQQHGRTMRMLKKGGSDARLGYKQVIDYTAKAAMKRINQMNYGDRTGALAFSSSTLGSTGSGQTLNCTSTAASTAGQTKGARRLKKGHYYNAINTSTDAIRGTFYVEVEGATSATINITSGTISSGDRIVDVSSNKRWWPGLFHLIGNHTRDLQGRDTSVDLEMNDPTFDLSDTPLTPAAIADCKAAVETRNNDDESSKGLHGFMIHGQYYVLLKQGYGFRQYINGNGGKVSGIPERYEDGDTVFTLDADCDDDRVPLFNPQALKRLIEKELGLFDEDGNEWRMWWGDNDAGSDVYLRAIGTVRTIAKVGLRGAALIKRASVTGVPRQASLVY